ncbi:Uncharacterised protein [Mycobacteroides abscessus]|nr:Uncharacterised protein [Mycobacteroides abscessus]
MRSGKACENGLRPTGSSIAAVIATTSDRRRPIWTISSAKTLVQPKRDGATGSPVSGWILPTAWKRSATSCSAGV